MAIWRERENGRPLIVINVILHLYSLHKHFLTIFHSLQHFFIKYKNRQAVEIEMASLTNPQPWPVGI